MWLGRVLEISGKATRCLWYVGCFRQLANVNRGLSALVDGRELKLPNLTGYKANLLRRRVVRSKRLIVCRKISNKLGPAVESYRDSVHK